MNVERNSDYVHLQENELLSLVQKAFPDCSHLNSYELLQGGAQNTHYKFKIEQGEFVLRLYARDHSHCKMEKELHTLIDDIVPTAKLIYADENNRPLAFSIFHFIDAIHISSVSSDLKNTLSKELGRTLALIHSFKFEKAGLFGDGMEIAHSFEAGSSPYFEETLKILSNGPARERLGPQLCDEALSFIEENKNFFPKITGNICLTHSDFKPVNLLYKNGSVVVLDWEFAHAGIGLLDFAILLRHRAQFPLELELLKEGYLQNGGSLPEEWLKSAMITDFVNMATMAEAASERPKLFKELQNSFETTMKHWNTF